VNLNVRRLSLLIFACCISASCAGRVYRVVTPSNIGLSLFERRIDGAGAAPDSVEVYLTGPGEIPDKRDNLIFEGQDAGRICYQWKNKNELHISISGGYVDFVSRYRRLPAARIVTIVFDGTLSCHWKPWKVHNGIIYYDDSAPNSYDQLKELK